MLENVTNLHLIKVYINSLFRFIVFCAMFTIIQKNKHLAYFIKIYLHLIQLNCCIALQFLQMID